jgi:hypothetical protein
MVIQLPERAFTIPETRQFETIAQISQRDVGQMGPILVAVAAVVIGVGGIHESDPELGVGRHLQAEAPGPGVVPVQGDARGRPALARELQPPVILHAHGRVAVQIPDQGRGGRVLTR